MCRAQLTQPSSLISGCSHIFSSGTNRFSTNGLMEFIPRGKPIKVGCAIIVLIIFKVLATLAGRSGAANKSDNIPCASPKVVASTVLYVEQRMRVLLLCLLFMDFHFHQFHMHFPMTIPLKFVYAVVSKFLECKIHGMQKIFVLHAVI